MGKKEHTPISKTRTVEPARNGPVDWNMVAERRFGDIEELNKMIQGWDLEFHQLKAGKSPSELIQLGRPEFMVSRFYFEQPYAQGGCTAHDSLTVGLIDQGVVGVTTPDGTVEQDDILCFPSGRELRAVSRASFRGYSLSISNTLVDEVSESCGLRIDPSIGGVQQVRRCSNADINSMRIELGRISRSLAHIRAVEKSAETIRDLEFSLVRHLLLAISDSREADRLRLTHRKRLVLQRAQEYMEAHSNEPIAVLELAQASGSCVRTLEYVFRDYFDATPKAYLKSRRLVAARRELRRSVHSKTPVNRVANRWGFWHMGQFASDYRRFFGELPSETLRSV